MYSLRRIAELLPHGELVVITDHGIGHNDVLTHHTSLTEVCKLLAHVIDAQTI